MKTNVIPVSSQPCGSSSRCKTKGVPAVKILLLSLQSCCHVALLRSLIANLFQLLHNNLPQGTLFGSYSWETSHGERHHETTLRFWMGLRSRDRPRKSSVMVIGEKTSECPAGPSVNCVCVCGNDERRWRWQRQWRYLSHKTAVRPSWMSWLILTQRVSMAQWGNSKYQIRWSDQIAPLKSATCPRQ